MRIANVHGLEVKSNKVLRNVTWLGATIRSISSDQCLGGSDSRSEDSYIIGIIQVGCCCKSKAYLYIDGTQFGVLLGKQNFNNSVAHMIVTSVCSSSECTASTVL